MLLALFQAAKSLSLSVLSADVRASSVVLSELSELLVEVQSTVCS